MFRGSVFSSENHHNGRRKKTCTFTKRNFLNRQFHSFSFSRFFQIGSFFMLNLCLVVIATQFSETKKREMEKMRLERSRFHSTSTIASLSESASCYAEILKYIAHIWRRTQRRWRTRWRRWQRKKRRRRKHDMRSDIPAIESARSSDAVRLNIHRLASKRLPLIFRR